MSDDLATVSSSPPRHRRHRSTEPDPVQWINSILMVVAVLLGVTVDIDNLLPLRTPGRVIFLIACALLVLSLSKPVSSSTRGLTGVTAAMTALVLVALWLGHRSPAMPGEADRGGTTQDDIAERLREREEDVQDNAARDRDRNRRVSPGRAVRLYPPLVAATLHVEPRGRLVGNGVRLFVPPPVPADVAQPCALFDSVHFKDALILTRLRPHAVVCLRTESHDALLLVTRLPPPTERHAWLEFQIRQVVGRTTPCPR